MNSSLVETEIAMDLLMNKPPVICVTKPGMPWVVFDGGGAMAGGRGAQKTC